VGYFPILVRCYLIDNFGIKLEFIYFGKIPGYEKVKPVYLKGK